MTWENTLRQRLDSLDTLDGRGMRVSIKIRADGGCFDRCCCPAAHRLIDEAIEESRDDEIHYERHESGPELLVCLALGTQAISLAKSVIDLVTAIIKARMEGQMKGDRHQHPIELIVRGFDKHGRLFDERVLKIQAGDIPSSRVIQKVLTDGLSKHLTGKRTPSTKNTETLKGKKLGKRKK